MLQVGYSEAFLCRIDRLSRICEQEFAEYGGSVAIYKLLKQIPERVTVSQLIDKYPSLKEVAQRAEETYLSRLPPEKRPQNLELRGPLLWGVAECERARKFFGLLCKSQKAEDEAQREQLLKQMGLLMTLGHYGDSVAYSEQHPISDAYLDDLIDRLQKDPKDPSAQIEKQPGNCCGHPILSFCVQSQERGHIDWLSRLGNSLSPLW